MSEDLWLVTLRSGDVIPVRARNLLAQGDFFTFGDTEKVTLRSERVVRRWFRAPITETVDQVTERKVPIIAIRADEVVSITYPLPASDQERRA